MRIKMEAYQAAYANRPELHASRSGLKVLRLT